MDHSQLDSENELDIWKYTLLNAARVFEAANNQVRQQMLRLLADAQEMSVTALHQQLQLAQAACSHHLSALRKAGLVIAKRSGHHVLYSVNLEKVRLLMKCAKSLP